MGDFLFVSPLCPFSTGFQPVQEAGTALGYACQPKGCG
jgi:hypothetical protein